MSILLGVLVGGCALFLFIMKGGSPAAIFDAASFMFVVFGTFGAMLVISPLSSVVENVSAALRALRPSGRPAELIEKTVALSQAAHQGGVFALDGMEGDLKDGLLKKGVGLILESADPAAVRSILEKKSRFLCEKEKAAADLLEKLAAFCLGIGMVGTLVNIAIMLGQYRLGQNPAPSISHSLLPVVYAAAISYLLIYPFAARIRGCSDNKKIGREMAVEGIMAIQAGEPPSVVRERLEIYGSGKKMEAKPRRRRGD